MKKIFKLFTLLLLLFLIVNISSCKKEEAKQPANPCDNGHTVSDWIVVTEKSCTTDGFEHKVCTVCGQEIEAKTHPATHNLGELVPQVDNTCYTDGTIAYYECSDCHKYFNSEKVEVTESELVIKASHKYGEWIEEVSATLETEGVKGHYHCEVCENDYNENNEKIYSLSISKLVEKKISAVLTTQPTKTTGYLEELNLEGAKLTVTYEGGNTEEVDVLPIMMVTPITKEGENIIECNYQGFSFSITLNVLAHTVAEAKALPVGTETFIKAVVAGVTCNSRALELLVKDEFTNVYMGIRGTDCGTSTNPYFPSGITQGDEISTLVKVAQSTEKSPEADFGKVFFNYTESDSIVTKVVGHGKDYQIVHDDSQLLVIDTEQKLRELNVTNALTGDVSERSINTCTYQVVKLTGKIGAVNYGKKDETTGLYNYNTIFYRIFIGDGITMNFSASSTSYSKMQYSDYQFNGTGSIVIKQNYAGVGLSNAPGEMLFGQTAENFTYHNYSSKFAFYGDLYMIYVGGSDYYVYLTFTSDSDIVPEAVKSVTVETVKNPNVYISKGINLEDQKLKVTYVSDRTEEIDMTSDMLDSYNLVVGKNTITGSYQGHTFSFEVTATDALAIDSIVLKGSSFSEGIFVEEFANATAAFTVTYADSSTTEIALADVTYTTPTFVTSGIHTITATYKDEEFTFDVTIKAHTIKEAKALESGVYTVFTGVFAGVVSNSNGAYVLLQDEGTNDFIGINSANSEFGSKLKAKMPDGVNLGDVITIGAQSHYGSSTEGSGDRNRIYFKFAEKDNNGNYVKLSTKVVATGKTYGINKEATGITEITTQQQFREFLISNALNSDNSIKVQTVCSYQVVKISTLKLGAINTDAYGRIYLGTDVSMYNSKTESDYSKMQVVDYGMNTTYGPVIHAGFNPNFNMIDAIFGVGSSTQKPSYESPLSFTGDVYLIFVGGTKSYSCFVLLSESDVISK